MVAANVQGKNKLQYIVKIFELRNSKKYFFVGKAKGLTELTTVQWPR